MWSLETFIGLAAAFCITVANLPQAVKVYQTRSTEDLSLKMLLLLLVGNALWVAYGALKQDAVIIVANAISFALLMSITFVKLTEKSLPGLDR